MTTSTDPEAIPAIHHPLGFLGGPKTRQALDPHGPVRESVCERGVMLWASSVVGTNTATCLPACTATNAARSATSVLPKPTSPEITHLSVCLGGQTEWAGISGFATEGDFIEVPSQMLEEFFRDEKLIQSFAKHYQTGETLPAEIIRKMKLAGAFGRADWVRSQLYYTTLSLDLHDRNPSGLDLDSTTKHLYQTLQPWTWLEGNRMYASFGHLTGYSSNYYTYAFDKVIALDFFAQFDPADLLGCEAGSRYRKLVLEQGGSKPGREMVRDFLGRDEEFAAFSKWLNEEFEGELLKVSR